MESEKPICKHCNKNVVNRPRGLCWGCYYKPGVKDKYPSTSKYANRGYGNGYVANPSLPEPTRTLPGTAEKMEVLRLRAERKQQLHHPLDPKCEPCEYPWGVPVVFVPIGKQPVQRNRVE